ncbi:MAG: hypothetical protein R3C97_16670 [Geminicoccaceae bacterium]
MRARPDLCRVLLRGPDAGGTAEARETALRAQVWWALSFPLAAMTIASFLFARVAHTGFHLAVGYVGLVTVSLVVLGLIWRTGVAIARHEICHPE